MVLTQFLHRNVRCMPQGTALVCGQQRVDHAELLREVAKVAGRLQRLGVAPGDRVAMLCQNGVQSVETLLACWPAGGWARRPAR